MPLKRLIGPLLLLAASALSRGGSVAQKAEYLPRIADGSLLAALAVDEGAKHRPLMTKLQAVRSGNGFRLQGDKAFVVDGHTADLLIVAARTASPARRASSPSGKSTATANSRSSLKAIARASSTLLRTVRFLIAKKSRLCWIPRCPACQR